VDPQVEDPFSPGFADQTGFEPGVDEGREDGEQIDSH
jgi:hypothetical protein